MNSAGREARPAVLLVHCRYRLPGGEDAVFAAERALLEEHGHTVLTYERSNGEAARGPAGLLLPLRAVWNRRAAREVAALILREGVDAVHIHNTLLALSPAVVRAARACGVPVVQTLHNFRLFCPNGVLLRDGAVCEDCPARGLQCALRHRCYRGSLAQTAVVAAAYALHRRLGTWRGVTLLAPTEFDRAKLLEFNRLRPLFDPERLAVKPNPVRLPRQAALPWAARRDQVVFAGRLEELKGLRTAIEAWKLLENDPAAPKLLLCGAGPLEGWARENAGENVEFLGQISHEALCALLAESRAALAPSLCYESFALVPAEAHAMGTPVIASDLGNVGAMVRDGVDGLRFAPGDPEALANAVRRLPDLEAKADPAAIRAEAVQKFGREENYRELAEIYQDILVKS